jgi:hypothetical protein
MMRVSLRRKTTAMTLHMASVHGCCKRIGLVLWPVNMKE